MWVGIFTLTIQPSPSHTLFPEEVFSISSRYCEVSVIFKERLSIYINSIAAMDIVLEGFLWAFPAGKTPKNNFSHAKLEVVFKFERQKEKEQKIVECLRI